MCSFDVDVAMAQLHLRLWMRKVQYEGGASWRRQGKGQGGSSRSGILPRRLL